MRIREAQKHTDPTNPDLDTDPEPQHCTVHTRLKIYVFKLGIQQKYTVDAKRTSKGSHWRFKTQNSYDAIYGRIF